MSRVFSVFSTLDDKLCIEIDHKTDLIEKAIIKLVETICTSLIADDQKLLGGWLIDTVGGLDREVAVQNQPWRLNRGNKTISSIEAQ